jgi:small subunit ribosomal protein S20
MANLRSSKKDLRRSAKKRIKNQAVRTALKTYVKKARNVDNPEAAAQAITQVQKAFDKAVQNGVIHKNAAARRKSRAAKAALKAAQAAS